MLQAVRKAWNMAVTNTFIIPIVCLSMAVPITVCMEWKNSKKEAERRKCLELVKYDKVQDETGDVV